MVYYVMVMGEFGYAGSAWIFRGLFEGVFWGEEVCFGDAFVAIPVIGGGADSFLLHCC